MINGLGSRVRSCLPLIGSSLLLFLATIASTPLLEAQSDGPLHPNPNGKSVETASADTCPKPLRVDVNVVLVPVVVTDAMNHPVSGLKKQNFSVFAKHAERENQYFSIEDSPISVGLLLDLSGSMANKVDAERSAVSEFFKNANAQDDYFVVTFSTHPEMLTEVTQSIGTIESKLAGATPKGSTAMLDAISLAMARMNSPKNNPRAPLFVSDGGDNNSHHKYREIKSLVRDSDVQVYAIGLFDAAFFKTFEEFMGKKWLSEMTDGTGARTIPVERIEKIP